MTPSFRTVDVRRLAAFRLSVILPLVVGCAHAVYDNQPGDQTTGSVSDPTASAGSLSSNVASSLPSEMDPDASAGGTPGTSDAGGAPSTPGDVGGTNSAGFAGSSLGSAGSSAAGAAAGGSSGMSSSGGAGMPAAGSGGSPTTGGAGAPPASAGASSGGASAGASSGGTTNGGSASAGASSAGSSSAGAASAGAPGNSCANVATWKLTTYSAGDLVQSGGKIYKCKEYPYTGWCGTSDAYAPTSGFAWDMAWDLVGPC